MLALDGEIVGFDPLGARRQAVDGIEKYHCTADEQQGEQGAEADPLELRQPKVGAEGNGDGVFPSMRGELVICVRLRRGRCWRGGGRELLYNRRLRGRGNGGCGNFLGNLIEHGPGLRRIPLVEIVEVAARLDLAGARACHLGLGWFFGNIHPDAGFFAGGGRQRRVGGRT